MIIVKVNVKLKDNVVKLSYKLIHDLFYFDDFEKGKRLYILIRILKY